MKPVMLSLKTLHFSTVVLEEVLGECGDQDVGWTLKESVIESHQELLLSSLSHNIHSDAGTHQFPITYTLGAMSLGA
jgi:hypothetical protein